MKVVIVSKTHMSSIVCVGGIDTDNNRSVRLLQEGGYNQPADTEFEVGQLWEIDYSPRKDVIPPHTEDVIIHKKQRINQEVNINKVIKNSGIDVWKGSPRCLFNRLIGFTQSGSGYISHRIGLPIQSTGFWISDEDLDYQVDSQKYTYLYSKYLKYVGFATPVDVIPAGTLIRVSLARWWKPEDVQDLEERCYVQLSGWYLSQSKSRTKDKIVASAGNQQKSYNADECALLWKKVLEILSKDHSESWLKNWFGNSMLIEASPSKAKILLKNDATWRKFEDHVENATEAALQDVLGYKPKRIHYGVR